MADLPRDLIEKWEEAAETGKPVVLGETVVCDACNEDYSVRPDQGGFIFGSYAYCPACAADALPRIEGYGETYMIRARCPEGKTFADFVREYRGPDAAIQITGNWTA